MSDQNTAPEVQQDAEQAPPNLTLQDLVLALQTIQVVVQRGAFKADEMSTVGGLYDRLFKFLDSQGALKSAPAESDSQSA
jgi:hypothetical protein